MPSSRYDKMIPDKGTDYLFNYYINEDKFNEQHREEWDEEMQKKIENHQPRITNTTEANIFGKNRSEKKSVFNGKSEREKLFSEESGSETLSEANSSRFLSQSSVKSDSIKKKGIYQDRIDPNKSSAKVSNRKYMSEPSRRRDDNHRHNEEHTEIKEEKKKIETPDERRLRAQTLYNELKDMKENEGVQWSRNYGPDSNPDDMQIELNAINEARNKRSQVAFYKQMLITGVCGVEFLNDVYDPFSLKLSGWSKQIVLEQDKYLDILGELYEKYKSTGGKIAPEFRLLGMLIFSGISFHISKSLFGGGLGNMLGNNPDVLSSFMNKFSGESPSTSNSTDKVEKKYTGATNDEPSEAQPKKLNNRDLLAKIRQQNKKEEVIKTPESNNNALNTESLEKTLSTTTVTELYTDKEKSVNNQSMKNGIPISNNRMNEEMQQLAEDRKRAQEMEYMRNMQMTNIAQQNNLKYIPQQEANRRIDPTKISVDSKVDYKQDLDYLNKDLDDVMKSNNTAVGLNSTYDFIPRDPPIEMSTTPLIKINNKKELENIVDSLTEEIEVSDILETSSKKKTKNKKSDTQSDGLSTISRNKKKPSVLKL